MYQSVYFSKLFFSSLNCGRNHFRSLPSSQPAKIFLWVV